MKDDLGTALRRAYAVPAASEDAKYRIRRRMAVPHHHARRATWPRRLAIVLSVCVTATFAYPVGRANYVARTIASAWQKAEAFTVTIRAADKIEVPGEHVRSDPIVAAVAGGTTTVLNPFVGGKGFSVTTGNRLLLYDPEAGRVVVRDADPSLLDQLTLPGRLMDELGEFRLSRRMTELGRSHVGGRETSEFTFDSDDGNVRITVDRDDVTGKPLQMRMHYAHGPMPDLLYDYDYDQQKARRAVSERLRLIRSVPTFDLDRGRERLEKQLTSSTVARVETGRDLMTVYRVQANARGDVFVLYTCRGYHGKEEMMGNWLRLVDDRGSSWLSDVIDMSFCKLKLGGQYPKAQVFFHPERQTRPQAVRLLLRLKEWGYVPEQVERPIPDFGNRWLTVASAKPERMAAGVPEWFHYAFNVDEARWLGVDALKLRFINALNMGHFELARQTGCKLEASFPEMMSGFFYDRPRLYLGLYHAYRSSDRTVARSYLQKALLRRAELEIFYQRDLDAARRKEGM